MKIAQILLCIALIVNIPGLSCADNDVKSAMKAQNNKKWTEAFAFAEKSNNAVLQKLIKFKFYISGKSGASFQEINQFIADNPKWPNIEGITDSNWPGFKDGLNVMAERAISDENFDKAEVLKWFQNRQPLTANGYKYYLQALGKEVHNRLDLIDAAWINSNFSEGAQKQFLASYGQYIEEEVHLAKIEKLLWNEQFAKAKEFIKFLSPKWQKVILTDLALFNKAPNAKEMYNALPAEFKYDSTTLYAYLAYDKKLDKLPKDSLQLIFKAPTDIKNGRKWWQLKSIYVRYFMQHKHYKKAYILAKGNSATDSMSISESEFLAGWIALRYLNNSTLALAHFTKLHNNVKTSMSLARASYWIARCYDAKGNKKLAADWFRKSAKYNYTFYGQLSLVELKQPKLNFVNNIQPQKYKDEQFKALKYLALYDNSEFAAIFAKHLISQTNDPTRIMSILKTLNLSGRDDLVIKIARDAAAKGVFFLDYAFPKPFDIKKPLVEKAWIYSIIRQETSFKQKVSINDDGMMQVIPETAKRVSKHLNLKFDLDKISSDHEHNIRIGSGYLKMLSDYYKNSYVLATPAYNAGESAVNQWIKRYGDPRHHHNVHQIVDWLENIPYFTTRNYAQRVLENLQIYRYIGGQKSLNISKDLKGR
jgi:soluble lytic murein transglycosylase